MVTVRLSREQMVLEISPSVIVMEQKNLQGPKFRQGNEVAIPSFPPASTHLRPTRSHRNTAPLLQSHDHSSTGTRGIMQPSALNRLRLTLAFFKLHNVLHPQLPLTPLQRNRLLGLVKDSFRQQLNSVPTPPTDSHVGNLLATFPFSTSLDGSGSLERIHEDPIGVFEQQVLAGRATLGLAGLCLNKYVEGIRTKGWRVGEESALGRVLGGLQKSGLVTKMNAITSSPITRPIIETLVAEGREAEIIDLLSATNISDKEKSRILQFGIVAVEVKAGIDKAVEMFERSLRTSGSKKYQYGEFQPVGLRLCRKVKDGESSKEHLLEMLVSSAKLWAKSPSIEAAIHLRFGRRAETAINYFLSLDKEGSGFWSGRNRNWYHKTVKMGLELGMVCVERENWEGAATITDIIRRRFCGRVAGLSVHELGVQDHGMARDALQKALEKVRMKRELLSKEGSVGDILNRWAAA
ncbi:unnamed protein product [Tuber aestivum]|uniref:Uncharacterized protein n=1 Tax=Tuber aestivum TaxID=59557 RepID=A0A292PPS7_9PEZI|nr:unnamed protein product [Tuber aestivum]